MNSINIIDMQLLDKLFDISSGWTILENDRTFAKFFEELGIDINNPIYKKRGTSKGKRLRCFLEITENKQTLVRVLQELWGYRERQRKLNQRKEDVSCAEEEFNSLISKLGGKPKTTIQQNTAQPKISPQSFEQLQAELMNLLSLKEQERGDAFEKFLKNLLDKHGMSPNPPYRLKGEQIDGSFLFEGNTYLIEAKWQNAPIGVRDLHTFQGKIDEKAKWTRGLFVSHSGFSKDGLDAFGKGKSVICMDGYDLHEMLNRKIPFHEVLAKKVRKLAETGVSFCQVRELFP